MNYYHVYRTTFLPENKCYWGFRTSIDPNWGTSTPADYIGSPEALGELIRKHGIKAFRVDVIFTNTDKEIALRYLRNILTPATLADPRCLNLEGVRRQNIANTLAKHEQSESHLANLSSALLDNKNSKGHELTDEHIQKLAEGKKIYKEKIKWYNNGIEEKRIDVANESIPTGWELGKLSTVKANKPSIQSNS